MTGSDEKIDILDRAKRKYNALMELFGEAGVKPTSPILPKYLAKAIREYENLSAIYNSMEFEDALDKYSQQTDVPSWLKPRLKRIVDIKTDWSWWGPIPEYSDEK